MIDLRMGGHLDQAFHAVDNVNGDRREFSLKPFGQLSVEDRDQLWPKLKDLLLEELNVEAGREAYDLKSFWKLTGDFECIDSNRTCRAQDGQPLHGVSFRK
jgi:hypothetical protein